MHVRYDVILSNTFSQFHFSIQTHMVHNVLKKRNHSDDPIDLTSISVQANFLMSIPSYIKDSRLLRLKNCNPVRIHAYICKIRPKQIDKI